MLPPGHIAAGYLTGYVLLKVANPALSPQEVQHLMMWTTFFGFAPDLDTFWAFFKQKSFLLSGEKQVSHRKFYSHAPIIWLVVGLLIYFFGSSVYIKYFGLSLWLGSWSHFLLDSIEYGIMWLWPFSNKVYALKNVEIKVFIPEKNFFKHTWQFLKIYSTRVTFYLEVLIILIAIITYFK